MAYYGISRHGDGVRIVMTCLTQIIQNTVRHLSITGRCLDSRKMDSFLHFTDCFRQSSTKYTAFCCYHYFPSVCCAELLLYKSIQRSRGTLRVFTYDSLAYMLQKQENVLITRYLLGILCLRGPECERRAHNSLQAAALLHCAHPLSFLRRIIISGVLDQS